MAGSRTTHNAKLVQRHQRQQSNALAQASANKFTQKQSHFERRREEEQIQQQHGSTPATSRSVGDGLLSRGSRHDAYRAEEEVRETPNPFARARSAHGSAAAPPPAASTRSATMGLERTLKSTRTTRRIDRFNLSASSADGSGAGQAGASLMGVRRQREGESSPLEELGGAAADAAPAKMTRAEKFREMISNTKGQRAQLQRERAERDAATLQLDAEINGLLHLLPKRNKTEEEQEAFAQSGTPEVRALLASYRRGHEAKCLTLKSSGEFEVRTLADAARTQPPAREGEGTAPSTDPTAAPTPAVLDAGDRALLAKIRSGAAASQEEREATAATAPGGGAKATRQVKADTAEARAARPPAAAADDFDAMMHSFQLDPRRAHAVPRTLTEEEEAAEAARQALLREDRQQVPALGLQERDQTQLTRGEWVQQGGDRAFHMDDDDEGEGEGRGEGSDQEDNVDIPSSFEGDSDGAGSDAESAMAAGEEEEEGEEDGGAAAVAVDRVSGSQTLDRLLEQLEQIANGGAVGGATVAEEGKEEEGGALQQRLHRVLVQLHRYASQHVVEATKAFRLILVEAERSFLRGTRRGGIRRALLIYLYAITKVFPTSDYRHEVMTPFLFFVCSALMQMKLDSLDAVHSYLVLTTLLLHCLKSGAGRYCGEAVVAVVNVMALQLPRAVLEPARYQGSALPTPLLDRQDGVLLNSSAAAEGTQDGAGRHGDRPAYQIGMLDTTHSPERLLLCAYHILDELCDLYRTTPAFPVMIAKPFLALDALLLRPAKPSTPAAAAGDGASVESWQPSPAVRLAHEALAVKVRDIARAVESHRTPLAMRTFRPRPIRQFDPLLAEREENAVKNEVRIMKRDIREDKKRLMRHLTAEATVQRRAQERRAAVDDAQREKRYHNVMSQLQQQQHSMNTVESLKSRAKAAKKKGISGESNAKPVGSGDAE